jgi:CheY-like chemotaxis protein
MKSKVEHEAEQKAVSTDGNTRTLSPVNILVAEDNIMNQLVIQRILEGLGAIPTIVENGEKAVQAALQQKFDLIFMDIQMPVLDGITATAIIRRIPGANMPIIAMSAHMMESERNKCREAGMNDYLVKPLTEQGITALLLNFFPLQRASTVAEEEKLRHRWLNMHYLSGICSNDTDRVNTLLAALAAQLPVECEQLKMIIQQRQMKPLERMHHYLKSTLDSFQASSPQVILWAELNRLIQFKVKEELIWDKSLEWMGSLQRAVQLLAVYKPKN